MATVTHSGTLPDSSEKTDFYAIIDNATVTGIVNADIAAGAAIADSKLAQVTTAGKVSGAALTSLTSVPSGAGVIPTANLPLTLVSAATGFTIAGGSTSKTLTLTGDATISTTPMFYGDARFKVGAFEYDLSTESGNQAITGVGFQPKVVILLSGVALAWSLGLYDGTTNAGIGQQNNSTQNSDQGAWAVKYNDASNNSQTGAISTLGADGFTIAWTKAKSPTGTLYIKYLAIK